MPLVGWIAAQHGVGEEQVVATNGSMQADAFLFDLMVGPGDQVVVEAPTYDRTLLLLRACRAEVLPIPLETDGLDVDELERALRAGARPKLAHVIPNFQNPAGYTLSLPKRRRLLELAEHGFVIFEDDPYIELRFEGERLPTMLSMDRGGRVVYASSFSKTVCPGIRVGYLVGPGETIAWLRELATQTYISPNMVAQAIVAEFCRSGALEASVAGEGRPPRAPRRPGRAPRRARARRRVRPPRGRLHGVTPPEGADVDALAAAAAERGVVFVRGADFFLEGSWQRRARLGRHARADRRRSLPAGRGLPEPGRRHGVSAERPVNFGRRDDLRRSTATLRIWGRTCRGGSPWAPPWPCPST